MTSDSESIVVRGNFTHWETYGKKIIVNDVHSIAAQEVKDTQ
jgi:hypothetical protein